MDEKDARDPIINNHLAALKACPRGQEPYNEALMGRLLSRPSNCVFHATPILASMKRSPKTARIRDGQQPPGALRRREIA